MGTGSSGGARGSAGGGGLVAKSPIDLTDAQAEALKDRFESGFDSATKKSIEKYISRDAIDSKSHSLSQTMNFLISRGEDLDSVTASELNSKYDLGITQRDVAAMRKTSKNIDAAMHDLGIDANLQRGAHAGQFSTMFGISDFSSMSESQLKKKMVGQTFKNTAVWSTSYDVGKNPFLSEKSSVSGGREVVYRIKAGSGTKCVFGAMDQAEIILGKGTNFRVTNVAFTGKTAKPKSGGTIKQIVVDLETF